MGCLLFAVYQEVTMVYQLTSSWASWSKAHAVYQVVQTGFQQFHEVFAHYASHFASIVESAAELFFVKAKHVAQFLLFLQLDSVLAQFTTVVVTVLTWRKLRLMSFPVPSREIPRRRASLWRGPV